MANLGFGVVPLGIPGTPAPFTLQIPDADLKHLSCLAKHSVIGAPTFYNTHNSTDSPEYGFGPTRDWLSNAIEVWLNDFDWRAREKHWNTFPQFTINVTAPSDGQIFNIHFAALFSKKPDAVPIIFSHGWPSSWLDFVPIFELLTANYTAETLPYHIITPSIPDFGLSTRSNVTTKELTFSQAAEALNELMKALGFDAYIAQGGDVGSGITAGICGIYDECKAVHFNNLALTPSETAPVMHLPLTAQENATLAVAAQFVDKGTGYMFEQGTKPSTIALALESSPLALLEW